MPGLPLVCLALATLVLLPSGEETTIRLTVDAAAEPKPALRYLLLPELREMTPGNPIPNYLKALLDRDMTRLGDEVPPDALRQADRAARMDKPDWQILTRLRIDGIALLLPDIQKMRELAGGLKGRFQHEVSLGRFDASLVTAKTMFAMARHMGEHPTLIGELVGIAIAAIAIGPLEEMLQQPGCPNLYWALVDLPKPLVGTEKAREGERVFVDTELRDLNAREPMSASQLRKVIAHIDLIRGFESRTDARNTREWLNDHRRDGKHMAAARKRLEESGIPADRLAKFPPDQILLLDEKLVYEIDRDEALKWANLPTWKALAHLQADPPAEGDRLLGLFLPSFYKIRLAQGRLEQRLALLQHIEALRMYAAGHEGRLPANVDEIDLPLPVDPFTGKPFRYELKDGTAHLRGSPPKGMESVAVYNLHYEITIRK